jgi:hypothetical protein
MSSEGNQKHGDGKPPKAAETAGRFRDNVQENDSYAHWKTTLLHSSALMKKKMAGAIGRIAPAV